MIVCFIIFGVAVIPINTLHLPNAVAMLVQRRRRWANIATALGKYIVFVVIYAVFRDVYIADSADTRR